MDENNTYVIKARTTGQMTLDNMAGSSSTAPARSSTRSFRSSTASTARTARPTRSKSLQAGQAPVVKTIKEYNEAVKSGKLGEMNPPCTYKKPHEVAKLRSTPCLPGRHDGTFGGPLINVKAEIQNLDGTSIPGLYAVATPQAASSSTTTLAAHSSVPRRSSAASPATKSPPAQRPRRTNFRSIES